MVKKHIRFDWAAEEMAEEKAKKVDEIAVKCIKRGRYKCRNYGNKGCRN